MEDYSVLQVDVNGEATFFLNKQIICSYSAKLRKLQRESPFQGNLKVIFKDFPGGSESFELISRFCYSNGQMTVLPSNLALLHSAAKFLEVPNALEQTERCIEEIKYWPCPELLLGLKQCQELETSESLAMKLMETLVDKLCLTIEVSPSNVSACSPDSSLFRFSCDSKSTESFKTSSIRHTWWFDEVLALNPLFLETFLKLMISKRFDHVTISRFLFYNQKVKFSSADSTNEKKKILESTIDTLELLDQSCVHYKNLFGILRLALGLNIRKSSMSKLEFMIGQQLDQATLDNLLVPSPLKSSNLYYVNLVLRFSKAFLEVAKGGTSLRLKKVARLIDLYITEVAPDPCLKPSKFLALLTVIPDSARDLHDGIYRAIDMYLQAHTGLTEAQKLNFFSTIRYEKLSNESRTHISQNPKFQTIETQIPQELKQMKTFTDQQQLILHVDKLEITGESEKLKEHMEGIQWRVMELEKACLKMQNQMDVLKKKSKNSSRGNTRSLPKLCS